MTTPASSLAAEPVRASIPARLWLAATTGPLGELVRFLAVGGTSALAYAALGIVFTQMVGLRPSLAIVATLALLMPPTYLAQRRFTFRSDRRHVRAFPRYVGTQIAGNLLAMVGTELFPQLVQARPWIAFAVIAVGVAATNYLLLKLWTFRRDP